MALRGDKKTLPNQSRQWCCAAKIWPHEDWQQATFRELRPDSGRLCGLLLQRAKSLLQKLLLPT
jgi:hypothetical protein